MRQNLVLLLVMFSHNLFANCATDLAQAYRLDRFPERRVELLKEKRDLHRLAQISEPIQNKNVTDLAIKNSSNSEDFLIASWARVIDGLESGRLFGKQLTDKELTSLSHQKDLLDAIVENPNLLKRLNDLGFDIEAYMRGTLDSDMGKLSAYQELFLTPSRKSDQLIDFMQGNAPRKSKRVIDQVLDEIGYPKDKRHFINPNLSKDEVRLYFNEVKAFLGYYHEFPGMIDAVLAFEKGILKESEFRSQLLANLFHNGPDEGFWKLLGKVIIPNTQGDLTVSKFFKETIFEEVSTGATLSYGNPTTFESFIAVFFDRMSQGSKGGYLKIDHELAFMEPMDNVRNLVLEESIDWTIDQLGALKKYALQSTRLTEKQRVLVVSLADQGSQRLKSYQSNMAELIQMPRGLDGKVVKPVQEMTIKGSKNEISQGAYKINLVDLDNGTYRVTDLANGQESTMNTNEVRSFIREQLESAMIKEERLLGDPMRSSYNRKNSLFSSPFGASPSTSSPF